MGREGNWGRECFRMNSAWANVHRSIYLCIAWTKPQHMAYTSSSCRAASTNLLDPLSSPVSIVHRSRRSSRLYRHRAVVYRYKLVALLFLVHMKGSTGVYRFDYNTSDMLAFNQLRHVSNLRLNLWSLQTWPSHVTECITTRSILVRFLHFDLNENIITHPWQVL